MYDFHMVQLLGLNKIRPIVISKNFNVRKIWNIISNSDMVKGPSGAQKGTVYTKYTKKGYTSSEYFSSTLGVDDCRLKINL
uniref:Uncharacterized protein n=1 Tax=Pithovirus LCDPAC02 TaxID=2506601 RepID=A0A481YP93_9VIRU|nr:MAG: hypothetical protein LCDPAC02_02800 [Pithovirus LCDPAC02]